MIGLLDRRETEPASPRTRLRRWLYFAGAVAVVAVLIWVIAFSSVLGVRQVAVSGTRSVSVAEIRAAAAIPAGTPLSRLDTAAVRDRVAVLPAVRTVTVHTSYPSTVRIVITERVAVGYREQSGGAALVDSQNVQFKTGQPAPVGLPALEPATDPARAAAAAAVAGSLPAGFIGKVARITAPSTESVTLTLTDGRTVLWGGTDRSADKAKLLPVLVAQPGRYFDLSDPTSVISRSAAPTTPAR